MRRGDCAGKLYVRILGGYLNDTNEDLRSIDCCVELEDQMVPATLSGRKLTDTQVPWRQEHLYLKSEATHGPDRWWFGSLASSCEAGATCADPSRCSKCTQTFSVPATNASSEAPKSNTKSKGGALVKENLLVRIVRKNQEFWRTGHKSGSGESLQGPSEQSDDNHMQNIDLVFCAREYGLDVNDFFGRLPVTFRIWQEGTKVHANEPYGARDRLLLRNRDSSKGIKLSTHKRKTSEDLLSTNLLLGSGSARLAGDSLSMDLSPASSSRSSSRSTNTCERRLQVVRLTGADGGVAGCLLVDMQFVPMRSKDQGPGIKLHRVIEMGQVKLVEMMLGALRRKAQALALTWRDPDYDNMNTYELAARRGQTRVLQTLLDSTNSSAWNSWINSTPKAGLTALHMAVLGNSAMAAQSLLDHARKQELTSSLFDSGTFDSFSETFGLERHRNLTSNITSPMLNAKDENGRTPFALACTLQQPEDPMLVVLSLAQLGADVAAVDNEGNTPLMLAIQADQTDVACALLDMTEEGPPGVTISRACPNMANLQGMQPLHVAAEKGNLVVVKALLEAGALAARRTSTGSTPLHFAVRNGHLEVAKALIEWPAIYAQREDDRYEQDQQERRSLFNTRRSSSATDTQDSTIQAQIDADASLAAVVAAMEQNNFSRFPGYYDVNGFESGATSGANTFGQSAYARLMRQRHEPFSVSDMPPSPDDPRMHARFGSENMTAIAQDDSGSRFQTLRRAKNRFSQLLGRIRQRKAKYPEQSVSADPNSFVNTQEVTNLNNLPDNLREDHVNRADDRNASNSPHVSEIPQGASDIPSPAVAGNLIETVLLGTNTNDITSDQHDSDADTVIEVDDDNAASGDEEDGGNGEFQRYRSNARNGLGISAGEEEDSNSVTDMNGEDLLSPALARPDTFGGVANIKEESVRFMGISRREALAHRDPGLESVEWSTWLTPLQIAEQAGHSDVYKYLTELIMDSHARNNTSTGASSPPDALKEEPSPVPTLDRDDDDDDDDDDDNSADEDFENDGGSELEENKNEEVQQGHTLVDGNKSRNRYESTGMENNKTGLLSHKEESETTVTADQGPSISMKAGPEHNLKVITKKFAANEADSDDGYQSDNSSLVAGPIETEIGTDEYYDYPFIDADAR